jgi:cell division protein FtsN
MSHDFAKKRKTAKKKPAKKNNPVPAWVWLFSGVAAGLFIAFLVYLADLAPRAHEANLAEKPPATNKTKAETSRQKQQKSNEEKGEKKPRFDFYTLLPEREIPVPDIPLEEERSKNKYIYILQAGSFRNYDDADRLRAKLILMGMDAKIETGSGKGGETWHRILVGPFTSRSKYAKARSTLVNKGIDTLLIKRKVS